MPSKGYVVTCTKCSFQKTIHDPAEDHRRYCKVCGERVKIKHNSQNPEDTKSDKV